MSLLMGLADSRSCGGRRSEESASHMSVLMHKHETLEKEHARMRLEHGLAQQSMEIQTREMLQLKRDLLESRER